MVVDGVAGLPWRHEHRRVVAHAAHAPADGQPVDVRQPEVENQRVGWGLRELLECFAAGGYRHHLVALEPQGTVDGAADRLIVVDHQDAHGDEATAGAAGAG